MRRRSLLALAPLALLPLPEGDSPAYLEGLKGFERRWEQILDLVRKGSVGPGSLPRIRKDIDFQVGVWKAHRAQINAGTLGPLWLEMIWQRELIRREREREAAVNKGPGHHGFTIA